MALKRIKKGDAVVVIAGKHRGHKGTVLRVIVSKDRVEVEGLSVKRHYKAGANKSMPDGGIGEKNASVHISNVALQDTDGKPTRVRTEFDDQGNKFRVAVRSGKAITNEAA